ncbi:MAG: hypothetical protein JWR15_677 [Prosthecobacter sp.]|nr:hypothetical protein [Prosthecobacter sp.]
MKPDLMTQLPRPQREAVESAGYRMTRWIAAREVLQTRVTKGRITGALGDFLAHWLSLAPAPEVGGELWLSFDQALIVYGGSAGLATSPLEHALLHLPALRSFWSQELRQQHFDALRTLVPRAWLMDPAEVPPGAVIQGSGAISWNQMTRVSGEDLEIKDLRASLCENGHRILSFRPTSSVLLNARYARNEKNQVVLRSIEAAP